MQGLQVYRMYLAMKQHFSKPNFDFFQYNGQVNAREETYCQRNDYYFFETIARKYKKEEVQNILLSAFIYSKDPTKVWIGDIKRDADNRRLVYQKQMDSLSYSFSQDCDTVDDYMEREGITFNTLLKTKHGDHHGHPALVKLYVKKQISLQSFTIFDIVLGFTKHWDEVLKDPLWEGTSMVVRKYKPFLSINRNKYRKIMREKFS